jgi:hypothetical protein
MIKARTSNRTDVEFLPLANHARPAYGTRDSWPAENEMIPWTGSRIEGTSPLLTVRTSAKHRTGIPGNDSARRTSSPTKVEPRVITS